MKLSFVKITFIAVLLVGMFSACSDKNSDPIIDPTPKPTPEKTLDYRSRIEVPKTDRGSYFIQHSTKEGNDSVMSYCFEYDTKKCHSRWIAFRFDKLTRQKNTKRPDIDPFIDDPSLSLYDYIGSETYGYADLTINGKTKSYRLDRGHLCASADRLYSIESNEQTFYMTNMSPQINNFNVNYWIAYEQHVQNLAQSDLFSDTLYVVKGGTIADDQIIGYVTRREKKVAVPKSYFIALLCVRNGNYKALGFLMEHNEYETFKNSGKDVTSEEKKNHVVTIDELEQATGIDFFHNLPDDIENKVEATTDPAVWGI